MHLKISFDEGTFKGPNHAFHFALKHLPFIPISIKSSTSFSEGSANYQEDKILELLEKNSDKSFTIGDELYNMSGGDEGNTFFYRQDDLCSVQYLIIKFEKLSEEWIINLITDAHQLGFFMAYLSDWEKTTWQNERFVNQFIRANKPLTNRTFLWDSEFSPIFNEEIIDVFNNPGHETLTFGTWLMAAPEMWFGKRAWKYFKKQEIKSFNAALEIKEISEDLIYIKLFEASAIDYEDKDILALQTFFREYSNMNEIEKILIQMKKMHNKTHGSTDYYIVNKIIVAGNNPENETVIKKK